MYVKTNWCEPLTGCDCAIQDLPDWVPAAELSTAYTRCMCLRHSRALKSASFKILLEPEGFRLESHTRLAPYLTCPGTGRELRGERRMPKAVLKPARYAQTHLRGTRSFYVSLCSPEGGREPNPMQATASLPHCTAFSSHSHWYLCTLGLQPSLSALS